MWDSGGLWTSFLSRAHSLHLFLLASPFWTPSSGNPSLSLCSLSLLPWYSQVLGVLGALNSLSLSVICGHPALENIPLTLKVLGPNSDLRNEKLWWRDSGICILTSLVFLLHLEWRSCRSMASKADQNLLSAPPPTFPLNLKL